MAYIGDKKITCYYNGTKILAPLCEGQKKAEVLKAPTIAVNSGILSILAGDGKAEHYEVYVDAVKKATTVDVIFDLSTLTFDGWKHTITVKAVASGYADSLTSNAVAYLAAGKLSAPYIEINGHILSITAGDNKTENYVLFIDLQETRTIAGNVFDLSTLKLDEGLHVITVKATASGYADSEGSNAVNYIRATLAAPTIKLNGDILSITGDEHTERYVIYVDGAKQAIIRSVACDLSTLDLSGGTHTITVKATASGYVDSPLSNEVSYVITGKLVAPTIALNGHILSITAGDNETKAYDIYADGDIVGGTGETTFDLSTLGLDAGYYEITVKARAYSYKDSPYSNSVYYSPISNEDTETVQIYGAWVFNEVIDLPTLYSLLGTFSGYPATDEGWVLTFSSYDTKYNDLRIRGGGTYFELLYGGQIVFRLSLYNDGAMASCEWTNEEYRYIAFENYQPIPSRLGDWWVVNATPYEPPTYSLRSRKGGIINEVENEDYNGSN